MSYHVSHYILEYAQETSDTIRRIEVWSNHQRITLPINGSVYGSITESSSGSMVGSTIQPYCYWQGGMAESSNSQKAVGLWLNRRIDSTIKWTAVWLNRRIVGLQNGSTIRRLVLWWSNRWRQYGRIVESIRWVHHSTIRHFNHTFESSIPPFDEWTNGRFNQTAIWRFGDMVAWWIVDSTIKRMVVWLNHRIAEWQNGWICKSIRWINYE